MNRFSKAQFSNACDVARCARAWPALFVAIAMAVSAVVVSAQPSWAQQKPGFLAKATGKAAKDALPPKVAAQACLATADELARNGHRREAIALYERARQLDPRQTQVSRVLAVLYDLERMDNEAHTEYTAALNTAPHDANLLNDVGYFYYQRHDHVNAERFLREAIAASPLHEHAHINLGLTLGASGRFQESYEAFAKVLSPAAAHSNVGMMLAKRGQRDEARRAFENAMHLDPDLRQAQAALAYLEPQSTTDVQPSMR